MMSKTMLISLIAGGVVIIGLAIFLIVWFTASPKLVVDKYYTIALGSDSAYKVVINQACLSKTQSTVFQLKTKYSDGTELAKDSYLLANPSDNTKFLAFSNGVMSFETAAPHKTLILIMQDKKLGLAMNDDEHITLIAPPARATPTKTCYKLSETAPDFKEVGIWKAVSAKKPSTPAW